ncbi:flavodoxin domain-containing protein, partial [Erwinia amylovora]|uniref:flavodoxin domain-containing protein n=1 Tax=Erwinia amylovora TaxID=552 RepID=UPI00200AA56E
ELNTTTQRQGEPPQDAVPLNKNLMTKKAPNMYAIAISQYGHGDNSYEYFRQACIDFVVRLAELGAERVLERVYADVDYAAEAQSCL